MNMITNTDGAMPELPEPDQKASEGVCCGNFTTGGEYMGQQETLCCGQPDERWPDYYTADQMREYASAAIQQAAGAVPEGWKLVPIKPTKQMLIELDKGKFGGSMGTDKNVVKNNYAAMLAASPSPLGREAGKEGSSDHLVPCAGGGWISVTVRLPEEWAEVDDSPCILEGKPVGTMYTGTEVLVSLSGDGVRLDRLVQIGESGKPWWSKYGERVTHWQPKPEPAQRTTT